MARVHLVGPRRLLPEVIQLLQDEGILHLRPLPVPLESWVAGVPVRGDPCAQERLEGLVARLVETLAVLPVAAEGASSEPAPDPGAVLGRYEQVLLKLAPLLAKLDGTHAVEALGLVLRRRETEALALFEEEVARLTGGAYTLLLREIDDEHTGGLLAVSRQAAPAVSRLLFERGVGEVKLPERYAGRSFSEGVRLLLARHGELARELEENDRARQALGRRWQPPLSATLREARDRLARVRAVSFCGGTRHAFLVAGWAPEERLPDLRHALAAAHGERITLFHERPPASEADEVPVVLKNPRWLRPFEMLLALQPLPRYGSIDPTPFLALFFPLYFGLILGDVGHGLLALAIATVAWRKGWGGVRGRKVAAVAIVSSISAIFFGVLFGEFFGELGEPLGLHPILLDRRHAMLPLLGIAVGLGAAQISLGVVLGFVSALRQGRRRAAAARLITLAVLGAIGVALAGWQGLVPEGVRTAALVTIGPLVVAAIVLEGLLAPLELVRILGSILSYSRLMAVGVAAVMLAEVANRLAVTVKPLAFGLALAVLLHAVNFAIGLLSPAIQALRLQYVEFFDTFFVPGGRPYAPLSAET
jgi:V/A-type H+/Na+-transporting ATPase subunit I